MAKKRALETAKTYEVIEGLRYMEKSTQKSPRWAEFVSDLWATKHPDCYSGIKWIETAKTCGGEGGG